MNNIQFPLHLRFQVFSLANDFIAKDANDMTIAYVRQKMFKFIDEIIVYSDESKSQIDYTIKADRWIDFSAAYNFTDRNGISVGRVARKGWASIWKAKYEIFSADKELLFTIREENPWAKVGDAVFNEIPLLGILTGYLFNPKYILTNNEGRQIARLSKEPSFTGRQFRVDELWEMKPNDKEKIVLGLMMMILMERRRG